MCILLFSLFYFVLCSFFLPYFDNVGSPVWGLFIINISFLLVLITFVSADDNSSFSFDVLVDCDVKAED